MRVFVGIVAGVFIVGLLIINAFQPEPMTRAERAAAERARVAEIAAEHNARMAELEAQRAHAPLRETAGTVAVVTVLSLVPLTVIGVGYFVVKRRDHVLPRTDGRLPVRLSELSTEEAYQTALGIQARDYAHAANTGVPQSITLSPTYAPRLSNVGGDAELLDWEDPQPQTEMRPLSGLPFDPVRVIVGHTVEGQMVSIEWEKLIHIAVGGGTGSGKTRHMAMWAVQGLIAGMRVMVIDPDGNNPDGLAKVLEPVHHLLWRPPAITKGEQASAFASYRDENERRGDSPDADMTPILTLIDEWPSIQRGPNKMIAADAVGTGVERGRKHNIRTVIGAQRWSGASAGGTDIRNLLKRHVVMQMRKDDARMMTNWPKEELPDPAKLAPGEAYVLDTSTLVRITTPQVTEMELRRVAAMLGTGMIAPAQRPVELVSPTGDAPAVEPGVDREAIDVTAPVKPVDAVSGPPQVHGWWEDDPKLVEAMRMADQGVPIQECTDHIVGKPDRKSREARNARQRLERALRDERAELRRLLSESG